MRELVSNRINQSAWRRGVVLIWRPRLTMEDSPKKTNKFKCTGEDSIPQAIKPVSFESGRRLRETF